MPAVKISMKGSKGSGGDSNSPPPSAYISTTTTSHSMTSKFRRSKQLPSTPLTNELTLAKSRSAQHVREDTDFLTAEEDHSEQILQKEASLMITGALLTACLNG